MLKAEHPTEGTVLASKVPDMDLATADPHDIVWRCTVEDCEMQFVDAEQRIKHFRHNTQPGHVISEESEEHRNIILKLRDYYAGREYTKNVSVEKYLEPIDRIADILLEKTNGNQIVIEIQLSKQSKQQFIDRTHDYQRAGYSTLWLLGVGNYLTEKRSTKVSGYLFSDVHKWLKKQYFGRHYMVMKSWKGIEVTPTRYEHKSRYIDTYEKERGRWVGGYSKKYDTVASRNTITLTQGALEPVAQQKTGDYYNNIEEFDVATFGEEPWW